MLMGILMVMGSTSGRMGISIQGCLKRGRRMARVNGRRRWKKDK